MLRQTKLNFVKNIVFHLIVYWLFDTTVKSGDVVFIYDDVECYLCTYSQNGKEQNFVDIRDKTPIISDDIKLVGAVFSAIYSRIPIK